MKSVLGGAVIIASFSILSRVLGLVRDNLFAKFFGASSILDAYNAAFKIPDLIFNFIILGALSASFVPVFLEVWQKNKDEAWKVVSSVLNILFLAALILVILAFIFAPQIVQVILMPRRSPLEQQQTIVFLRIMLLGVLFFSLSNVCAGILHSLRKFLSYSLAPVFYNIGIILGVVFLVKIFGPAGLAYGVVLGAALHFFVQLPAVIRTGWHWQPAINFSLLGVKKIFRLMLPRSLALGLLQINAFIIAILALRLKEGSLTIWTWADNLQHFPINIFGVSLAISVFPVFSQAWLEKNHVKFRQSFSLNFRRILFFIIPVSIATLLLRAQIVRLILGSFGGGKFDWSTTILTAQILGFFSLSMFAQASIPLLIRSFFAQQDTKTPVVISFLSVALNAFLGWYLSGQMGLYGLALAFSLSALFQMLLLLIILRLRFGDLDDGKIILSTVKITAAAIAGGVVLHGLKYFIAPLVDMHTFVGIFLQTAISLGAAAIFYFYLAWRFNFEEFEIIKRYLIIIRRGL